MKNLIVAVLLLGHGAANAVPVTYTVTGQFALNDVGDKYDLDGASFIWMIGANTDYVSTSSVGQLYYFSDYEYSMLTVTNRPNGQTDIFTSVAPTVNTFGIVLDTVCVGCGGVARDQFRLASGWQGQEYDIYSVGGGTLESEGFYPESSPPAIPEYIDSNDSFLVIPGNWRVGDDRNYDSINWHITTSVVPIPAAFWLFGSALMGLGWMRRKA